MLDGRFGVEYMKELFGLAENRENIGNICECFGNNLPVFLWHLSSILLVFWQYSGSDLEVFSQTFDNVFCNFFLVYC